MEARTRDLEAELAASSGVARASAAARLARALAGSDMARAEQLAQEALSDAVAAHAEDVADSARLALATCAFWRGELGPAREILEAALATTERRGDDALAAGLHDWLGTVAGRAGKPALALRHHAKALDTCIAVGDRELHARVLNNLGLTHHARADFEAALDSHFGSLRIKQELGDRRGEAITLGNLGCTCHQLRDYDAALECFKRSHATLEELGATQYVVLAAANAADTLTELGRLGEADEWLLRAEGHLERLGLAALRATAGVMRARWLTRSGRAAEAAALLTDIASHVEAASEPRLAAEAGLALGLARLATGDPAGALRSVRDALNRATRAGAIDLQIEAQGLMATCHERAGDPARALEHVRRHVALRDAVERERGSRIAERFKLRLEAEHLRRRADAFEAMSQTDPLTSLPNRRVLDHRLAEELAAARESGSPLAVAVADLDHFKSINDMHGHATGDEVLRRVATIVQACLPQGSLVARTGGEEFVLVMPSTDRDAAARACERLRAAVELHDWSAVAPSLRVTSSFGWTCDANLAAPAELLGAADRALYRAKASGRNRVEEATA